jgi:ribosomal protein S18 acetylase RimI-like enzyme
MITYRRMTIDDVPQVHEIELKTFHTPWSYQSFVDEMTTNKCARYVVAEEDGKVLGMGDHEEMMASCEEYRYLAKTQMRDGREAL